MMRLCRPDASAVAATPKGIAPKLLAPESEAETLRPPQTRKPPAEILSQGEKVSAQCDLLKMLYK